MLEFYIELRVGNVAARRHIEIMQRHRIAQAGAFAEHGGHVPAVGLAAEILDFETFKRQAGEHGDAMITLLPVDRRMFVAEPPEALQRKRIIRAFRLLQAEDVGPRRLDEFGDEIDAQPHRVDIPGGDLELHPGNLGCRMHSRYVMAAPAPAIHQKIGTKNPAGRPGFEGCRLRRATEYCGCNRSGTHWDRRASSCRDYRRRRWCRIPADR